MPVALSGASLSQLIYSLVDPPLPYAVNTTLINWQTGARKGICVCLYFLCVLLMGRTVPPRKTM